MPALFNHTLDKALIDSIATLRKAFEENHDPSDAQKLLLRCFKKLIKAKKQLRNKVLAVYTQNLQNQDDLFAKALIEHLAPNQVQQFIQSASSEINRLSEPASTSLPSRFPTPTYADKTVVRSQRLKEAAFHALVDYEENLRVGLKLAFEFAVRNTPTTNKVQGQCNGKGYTLLKSNEGESVGILGDAPMRGGQKELYVLKGLSDSPCLVGIRTMGQNRNLVVYYNAGILPQASSGQGSWEQTVSEVFPYEQTEFAVMGCHTTTSVESPFLEQDNPNKHLEKLGQRADFVSKRGSHTSFDLMFRAPKDLVSRVQLRPRIECIQNSESGEITARCGGNTVALASRQDDWRRSPVNKTLFRSYSPSTRSTSPSDLSDSGELESKISESPVYNLVSHLTSNSSDSNTPSPLSPRNFAKRCAYGRIPIESVEFAEAIWSTSTYTKAQSTLNLLALVGKLARANKIEDASLFDALVTLAKTLEITRAAKVQAQTTPTLKPQKRYPASPITPLKLDAKKQDRPRYPLERKLAPMKRQKRFKGNLYSTAPHRDGIQTSTPLNSSPTSHLSNQFFRLDVSNTALPKRDQNPTVDDDSGFAALGTSRQNAFVKLLEYRLRFSAQLSGLVRGALIVQPSFRSFLRDNEISVPPNLSKVQIDELAKDASVMSLYLFYSVKLKQANKIPYHIGLMKMLAKIYNKNLNMWELGTDGQIKPCAREKQTPLSMHDRIDLLFHPVEGLFEVLHSPENTSALPLSSVHFNLG